MPFLGGQELTQEEQQQLQQAQQFYAEYIQSHGISDWGEPQDGVNAYLSQRRQGRSHDESLQGALGMLGWDQSQSGGDVSVPTGGGGGGYGGGGTGSLLSPFDVPFNPQGPINLGGPNGIPWIGQVPGLTLPDFPDVPAFQAPSVDQALNDPGYKFRVGQGQQGIQNWAAAKGTLGDSGTAKSLSDYNQNAASQEYGNVWGREYDMYNTNYRTQYMDPWQAKVSNTLAMYQPQFQQWQAQNAAGQHATDMNYLNDWNLWLQRFNIFRDQRDSSWDKTWQYRERLMPPYRYESYRNPYAASIADLLARQGDIAAQRAERIGAIEANRAATSGDIWGQTIGRIGQTVAAIPQQVQASKRQGMQDEMDALQLADAKRANRSRNIFEVELRNPKNYNADGTVNDEKVAERLKQQDVGAWQQWTSISAKTRKDALDHLKTLGEIAASQATTEEKQRATNEAQGLALGKIAYHAGDLLAEHPTDPMHARDTTLAATARAITMGLVDPEQGKAYLMQTAQLTPDKLAGVFASFVPPELRVKLDQEKAQTASQRATTQKTEAEIAGTLPQTPAQVETARHNAAMERIALSGAGRDTARDAEIARHNKAMEDAARNTKTNRPVIAGDAEDLANFDTSLDDLSVLKDAISTAGATGTIAKMGASAPNWVTDLTGWGTDAKKKQALIDRVKQVIGKTLEGGVLRKEDELKYEKILPTIYDVNEVVISKLAGIDAAIEKRKGRRLDSLEDAGFDVSRFRARDAGTPAPAAPDRTPPASKLGAPPPGIRNRIGG